MTSLAKVADYPLQNSINNVEVVKSSPVERIVVKLMDRDCSRNTAKAVLSDLKHFFVWYTEANGEGFRFNRVTGRDARDYRAAMQKDGLSVATINRRLTSLSQFFKMALEEKAIQKNPMEGVKQLTRQSLAPKGLTGADTRKLLKEVELRGNLRDMAMIELMLGAGLRVSEVVKLEIADVHISDRKGSVLVRHAKGGKTRTVPLNKEIRSRLDQYIEERDRDQKQLFIGQRGTLTPIAVNKIIEKYAEKSAVRLSPHTLRHTFAYNYLKENQGDIIGLAQILGHSNVNTTAIYTQNRLEDLQEKVEKVLY